MYDFLERFQNRMEFCAIIGSIVNRKNKTPELRVCSNYMSLTTLSFLCWCL